MTTPIADDPLLRYTDDSLARPLPTALHSARADVVAAVRDLRTIPDTALTTPWGWKGGSEEEIRYGFYRIIETFERAGIDAGEAILAAGLERGRAAAIAAPATAARWDLQGLLVPLSDTTWDANPGADEWTIRQTLGHVIASQRGYAATGAWWQERAYRADDPELPTGAPESIFDELPSEDAETEGTPAEIRDRLDDVVDRATERLAGVPADRLAFGARWSGFAVDVGFRMARWSSHIREHSIQVEKTLVMLDLPPTEVDRLVRLVLAAWGRAEAVVYGSAEAVEAVRTLATAAASARETAAEIAGIARADAGAATKPI
jgi:hypothetical protein